MRRRIRTGVHGCMHAGARTGVHAGVCMGARACGCACMGARVCVRVQVCACARVCTYETLPPLKFLGLFFRRVRMVGFSWLFQKFEFVDS